MQIDAGTTEDLNVTNLKLNTNDDNPVDRNNLTKNNRKSVQ